MKTANWTKTANDGVTARLAQKISDKWLKDIAETNPAILSVFAARDVKPYRDLLAWSGEFAGKYLTGAYFVYRLTGDTALKKYVLGFIEKLLGFQSDDGYLGCFSRQVRLCGALSQHPEAVGETWDLWGHYHIMFGLLLWYKEVGNETYLQASERMARLIMRTFYGKARKISETGFSEMNLAVYHAFGILYNLTKKEEYYAFARKAEEDLRTPQAGNYLEWAHEGKDFYRCPKPRWESLHVIMGFAEMYRAGGEEKYLSAVERIVRSILKTDVHNTGGFSTDEQAIGTPYRNGVIELCCVVAFDALTLELFRLRETPDLIDSLEIAHYNAVMGSVSPSGGWATYDTPMEGEKLANFHQIDFQCRPGSPMLNCCSANFARGVAEYSEWALTENEHGIYINGFEPVCYVCGESSVEIRSNYPYAEKIEVVCVNVRKNVFLRVPGWARKATLTTDGTSTEVCAGYVRIPADGHAELCLDFSPRTVKGGDEYAGKFSIYRGPVLLAYDLSDNAARAARNGGTGITVKERLTELCLPVLSEAELSSAEPTVDADGKLLLRLSDATLTDFRHAGFDGGLYKTWFEIR